MQMADTRRMHHLRPGTRKNLLNQFRVFLSVCIFYRLNALALTPSLLCAYIEFLLHSYPCRGTVKNYVSALTTLYTWLGLDIAIFKNFQVKQMWRAIDLTVRYTPRMKHSLSVAELRCLMAACVVLGPSNLLFRAFLSILYFTMVRVSSLLPYTIGCFDVTRHVNMSDVVRTQTDLSIRIKWAKNSQNSPGGVLVPLQSHCDPAVCPILNLNSYLHSCDSQNMFAPLFHHKSRGGSLVPFTVRLARQWLRLVQRHSVLAGTNLGFHAFRRGACDTAFARGAPIADIKIFGNWSSDAVLNYLKETPAKLRVSKLLASNL